MDTLHLPAPKPCMIAHRGCSGLEMENTCSAFVAAGNRSYFGIETDVHITSDRRFVIIHDDTTGRVAEKDLPVEGSDFETLRSLPLRDRDGLPGRRDLMLPSLAEYIGICRKYEKNSVLELKNHMEPTDIDRIIQLIRSMEWLEHTIFISFDLPNVQYVRRCLPDQQVQFLVETDIPDLLTILKDNDLDLDMDVRLTTPELVRGVHAIGHKINVWTVNTLEEAEKLTAWGVDYITSNIVE